MKFSDWIKQATTGQGFAGALLVTTTYLQGGLTLTQFVSGLVAAAVLIAWPERTALSVEAGQAAGDLMGVVNAYQQVAAAGAIQPPPAPTPAPIPVSVVGKPLAAVGALLLLTFGLAACSSAQVTAALSSPTGQLFCALQTGGGGTIVAGVVDAEASALNPAAGQVAVIATNAAQKTVQDDCAKAAAAVGLAVGVPVSPPPAPATAPQVAIVVASTPSPSPAPTTPATVTTTN